MKSTYRYLIAIAITTTLAACGEKDHAPQTVEKSADTASSVASQTAEQSASSDDRETYKYSLSDGLDICFRKLKDKLGGNAKVSSIDSSFSEGKDIDSEQDAPRGALTTCLASYQDPSDARKLLRSRMNVHSGQFETPEPVEIDVTGDASKFNLNDYVIALNRIDASPLQAFLDSRKLKLS
ncbi:hypothetical protein BN2476_30044 [Paraburkholderia piptadeniae]|uniref:Lipoprotein n=1 Tax=Paraburkholderia piptadeniae TaxID=1701573 RepID=A0A1N7RJY7_9BURK|nr:hypothetical protein [Paraburkholderia piptadeniae]SIT35409.1 hypothetical protein BN2476_30044 [Paraburkholderia piptadeniae]